MANNSEIFDVPSIATRPLESTSVNVHFISVGLFISVGRPGLDPGTLGLKETFIQLRCVGLVAHVVCFQGIVLSCVGLVSWGCGNMRPKMRPVQARGVALDPPIRLIELETILSPANPSRFSSPTEHSPL